MKKCSVHKANEDKSMTTQKCAQIIKQPFKIDIKSKFISLKH